MLRMEIKFLTPTEVWEGFDAHKAPLEASIISAQTQDNIVCSQQIFTADTTKEGRVRVFCKIFYDGRWQDKRPALLVLPSFDNPYSQEAIRYLVEEGYVTCVLDYCGTLVDTHTSYPSDLSFASFPSCKQHLDDILGGARNTPWFVWSKVARRAISLLEEQSLVATDRIGVIGFGIGAQLSWQVSGTDNRVRALVAANGGGYRWATDNPKFLGKDIPDGDEQLAYSTGVGAETYAKFVNCPTLAIATRDSIACDVDRIGDMLDLVKCKTKQLIISDSCGQQFTKSVGNACLCWLRKHLSSDGEAQVMPTMKFDTTDGRLYVRVNSARGAKSRRLYISYGEPISKERYWTTLDIKQKVGEHEYVCDVPVYDKNELIVAYATFDYDDGDIISTKVVDVIPAKHDVTATDSAIRKSSIIYDGSMGIGAFSAKSDSALLDENSLKVKEGPFGIKGISLDHGVLSLCRSIHEMKTLPRSASLHIDAYSATARTLEVSVLSYPDLKRYTAHTNLTGGEFWQKLLFECSDFKSEEGKTLSAFGNAKVIEIISVDGAILNNFLWI